MKLYGLCFLVIVFVSKFFMLVENTYLQVICCHEAMYAIRKIDQENSYYDRKIKISLKWRKEQENNKCLVYSKSLVYFYFIYKYSWFELSFLLHFYYIFHNSYYHIGSPLVVGGILEKRVCLPVLPSVRLSDRVFSWNWIIGCF